MCSSFPTPLRGNVITTSTAAMASANVTDSPPLAWSSAGSAVFYVGFKTEKSYRSRHGILDIFFLGVWGGIVEAREGFI